MKHKFFHSWLTVSLLLAIIASVFTFQSARAGGVLFADPGGLTSGSCDSWVNACTLQYALSVAVDGDQIWVKMGKHKPTTSTTDRNASFALKDGVEIYGGFAGTENFKELRNPTANLTILSGDIDNNDTNHPFTGLVVSTDNIVGGNSYHVVTADFVDDNAVLDGFTINAGHANGSVPHQSGAGMYNYNSSPTLANLYFMANLVSGSGGGMYNYDQSSPSLTNVTFSANKADNGGGMYNYDVAHPTLANVTFQNNLATNTGGGMMNVGDSAPTLTDVTFHSNAAEVGGGGMTNYNEGNPTLTNVTFTENTAPYGGGGMYNVTSSPTLNYVTFEQNSDSYSGGGGMYNSSSTPTLNNVTFTQNTAYSGGGMYNIDSTPTLAGVGFFSNTAEHFGGGIYNTTSHMTSLYGHFSGNSANRGGGVYNHNSAPSFTSTVFTDNIAVTDGGGMFSYLSTPSLVNAIFSGNQAGERGGGAYNSEQSPTFINVTITNNSAVIEGGGIFNDYSPLDLANSIVWGNTAPSGAQLHNVVIQPTIVYSDIQGCGGSGSWAAICGTDGGGNIDADPKFVDLGSNDLRLQLTSPAIDAGRNSNVPGPITLDMNASSRFVDVASVANTGSGTAPIVDMGAFEAKEILYVAPTPAGIGDCSDWDNACTIWNAFVDAYEGHQMWVKQGVYKPTWDSSDREASFTLKNGVEIYGGFAGSETALSARNPVTNITVLSGDIDDNDTTNSLTGVVEHYSHVSGENSYRIVSALGVDDTAVLDGFYINAGQANGTYDSGGGLYTDGDPTLSNLYFVANSALMGGGLYNDGGSPALTDVVFLSNFAPLGQGAGMYDSSLGSATLTNVTFNLNSADQGGGMYIFTSSPTLTNVTFSANFGDYGGGLMNFAGTPVLTNVTFSGNSASSGGAIYNTNGGSPTLKNTILANTINGGDCVNNTSSLDAASSHNLVEDALNACGLTDGVNSNIVGQDPNLGALADNGGFAQTHALPYGSVAINAGTNTGCPATDQRGVARPQGAVCDIGAYEYQTPSIEVFSGGVLQGTYAINPGDSQRLEYAGLNNGPVVVSSASDVLSSIRVLYKGVSYSEMLGFPAEEITNEYWFPVYDSATLNSQLRIGNLGSESTTITVYLGDGEELDSFTLGSNAAIRKNYTGENDGPLRVVSSATDILVSVRLLYGDSYTEELGFPADQLTTDYWFPWYNNVAFPSELRVANTGGVVANVTVYIGDNDVLDTFSIPVGEAVRVSYAGENNGPLRVVTSSSSILPSIRVIYKGISYSEMLGLPNSKLTNEYWLPAYDSTSVNSQLRIGNVGGQSTTITVYLGDGEVLDSFTLGVGAAVRKNYTGEDGGPLRVVSSASNVLVTNRILLVTASYETYYELLAYPDDSLSGELWFPWYNNLAFLSELRIAVP
jgi:predicted outer membrane repeat protein